MWFNYLINKIQTDYEKLNKLYEIDYDLYTSFYSPDYLNSYINKNKNVGRFFNENISDTTFLLEGSSTALISVINDYYDKNIKVIINDDNVAINTWIKKVYEDFCRDYSIRLPLMLMIDNHFKINTSNVVVIGSSGFITEMKRCLKDKNIIAYEYEG